MLRNAQNAVVPSKERFDAMFSALMAGKTPPTPARLPKASPFGQISGILNSNVRDLRITAVRTTKGITLMFDYALVTAPRQLSKLANKAWQACVKHLD